MNSNGRQNLYAESKNNRTKIIQKKTLPPARGAKAGPNRIPLKNLRSNATLVHGIKMTHCKEYAQGLASFF